MSAEEVKDWLEAEFVVEAAGSLFDMRLRCEKYVLDLRSDFGTSHSSTAQRTNALLSVSLAARGEGETKTTVGWGEVGLPPKKPGCYLADYSDVLSFFAEASHSLPVSPAVLSADPSADPFGPQLPLPLCGLPRRELARAHPPSLALAALLLFIDRSAANRHPYANAARCGIEVALLDCWGQILHLPIHRLLGPAKDEDQKDRHQKEEETTFVHRKGFYTVGINPDLEAALAVVEHEAGDTTGFLKIKINSDTSFATRLLTALNEKYPWSAGEAKDWVLDANAAWTVADAEAFVEVLRPFRRRLYMVEQPWPVGFLEAGSGDHLEGWARVKRRYNEELGVLLVADESVATRRDVALLQPFADGVNVKLEKAGGLRGALQAMVEARRLGMVVWCGMMVGSALASSAAGHLLWMVSEGVDLDGSLLVTPSSNRFQGGITWAGRSHPHFPFGGIGWIPGDTSLVGVGCTLSPT